MKSYLIAASVFVLGLSLVSGPTYAQAPAAAPTGRPLVIRKIKGEQVRTPEYQAKNVGAQSRSRAWYKIEVSYDVEPDWLDEVTFTYYVVVKAKEPIPGRNSLWTLFKGEVTYVNIEKGRDKRSDIYLHPSTLARFGAVERVAAVVSVGGRMVAMEGEPALAGPNPRWWEQLTPQDGYLMNRMQTPFAMINFDDYEAVKPAKP